MRLEPVGRLAPNPDPVAPPVYNWVAGGARVVRVVFPRVGKGGLVVGGAHGEGLVYEKEKLVGRAVLSQATIGAQIGGQVFREVILLENAAAVCGADH